MPYKNKEEGKAKKADYYAANADKIKANVAKYQAANVEKINAVKARYRSANSETIKVNKAEYYIANAARIKAYRSANANKIRARSAEYYAKNPEAYSRARHKRRALKAKCGGVLSKGLTEKLLLLQKGKCACCKKSVKAGHHLDHIYPLSKGGANEDSNIQILCPSCNRSKGAKHPQDFMQSRGFLF